MPGRRRRLGVRLLIGLAVLAVVGTAGGIAYARSGGSSGYRTATVTRGSVTATLALVGTVTAAQDATVGFAQAGTVASVAVAPGDHVTAGQQMAQLDLTALQATLTQAQAAEANDRQTLAAAENGQLTTTTGSRTSSSASSTAADAQKQVVSAQRDVDTAQGAVTKDLAAATAVCPAVTGTQGTSGTSNTRRSTTSAAPSSAAPTSTTSTQSCLAAERTLLAAQAELASREGALSSAQSTLTRALTGSSSATSSTSTVSAAQLAAYQAALDADTAAVVAAQQDVDQGTAVSPLTGTVVAVGLTVGQTVTAASTTAVIEIAAPGSYQVGVTVPLTSIHAVAVGQSASVVPDGGSTALPATVTAIAPAPSSTGYPVTLGLTGSTAGLRQGASASVQLTTGSSHNGIVVPTSAVHTLGSQHVVEVLSGTTVRPTTVSVGTLSALRTEILSGLSVGQQVVLADLSSTVTSDSSTTTGSGGALGGRAPGGGGFAGARTARVGG